MQSSQVQDPTSVNEGAAGKTQTPAFRLADEAAAGVTREGAARVCGCFRGFCTGGGLLSMGDLLGADITAGAGMFCALFLEMAVYVTALQGEGPDTSGCQRSTHLQLLVRWTTF